MLKFRIYFFLFHIQFQQRSIINFLAPGKNPLFHLLFGPTLLRVKTRCSTCSMLQSPAHSTFNYIKQPRLEQQNRSIHIKISFFQHHIPNALELYNRHHHTMIVTEIIHHLILLYGEIMGRF